MKRLISLTVGILVVVLGLAIWSQQLQQSQGATGDKVLNLANWGDYIDPSLVKKFEKQSGYHVNLETFDSNEAMFTKIQQGGTSYDLTVPSEYMIEKMRKANLLVPLDHSKLTGLNNYGARYMNQPFDPGNKYSIPYFWGTLGIVYNDKFIKPGEVKHWDDLWHTKYRDQIMLIDSARDILGFSLVSLGKSMNTTDAPTLQAAKGKLDQLAPNVKAIVADEIKMYMIENEAPLAVDWSGEASEMLAGNSHLHYVVPSEGSNLWFDSLVIPKTAKHYKAIYAFLNFMSQPKNAAQNAEYVGYATPNNKAKALLPKAVRNDRQFYPDAQTMSHLQTYEDLSPKTVGLYNDLFLEFKMYRK
ncbi:ABC transporter substrate-binding protein [Lacticaseibacillus saniviri]|uniref:Spermidine putrescine-binding periplasmic protein n=2 Tax=Lacticaseibacillus saniviri TaxID=931533 RepID=A0A0R2MSS8_9LACO|nr:ABC transporter substrate-binding protein [Lacticaseibacillus saniviri]KRO16577.1 spermidine putrescine-binding periplasmic protein [Lacticaseibacillus saniviri JCM 17471 = DSM 24301]